MKINNMTNFKLMALATALMTAPLAASADNYLSTTGGSYQRISDATTLQENDIIVIAAQYKTSSMADSLATVYNGNTTVESSGYVLPDSTRLSDLLTISAVNDESKTLPREFVITNVGSAAEYFTGLSCNLMDINNEYMTVSSTSTSTTKTVAIDYSSKSSDATSMQLAYFYKEGNTDIRYTGMTSVFYVSGTTRYFLGGNKVYARFDLNQNYTTTNAGYVPSTIYQKVYPLTVSSAKYATLYFGNNDVRLPEGVKAYTYKYDDTGTVLQPDQVLDGDAAAVLPHGTAVIICADEGTYYLPIMSQQSETLSSALSGSDEETTTSSDYSSAMYYSLSTGDNGVGFYWQKNNGAAFTNGAHKAYLAIDNSSSTNAKSIRIVLPSGEVTGVEYIREVPDEGKADDAYYSLQGIKTTAPKDGIYIKNGKKIVVK